MTATHDTTTLAQWWEESSDEERDALLSLPQLRDAGAGARDPFGDRLRDAILRMMYASGSGELLLPVQDLFGWRDRINTPGTVGEHNWTWRLPWPVDLLPTVPEAAERARFCRRLAGITS
jgi:4-alpha-glucanotransferase